MYIERTFEPEIRQIRELTSKITTRNYTYVTMADSTVKGFHQTALSGNGDMPLLILTTEWQDVGEGVLMKLTETFKEFDDSHTVMLVKWPKNIIFPKHYHTWAEFFHVLDGECSIFVQNLETDEVIIGTGDSFGPIQPLIPHGGLSIEDTLLLIVTTPALSK